MEILLKFETTEWFVSSFMFQKLFQILITFGTIERILTTMSSFTDLHGTVKNAIFITFRIIECFLTLWFLSYSSTLVANENTDHI